MEQVKGRDQLLHLNHKDYKITIAIVFCELILCSKRITSTEAITTAEIYDLGVILLQCEMHCPKKSFLLR